MTNIYHRDHRVCTRADARPGYGWQQTPGI